MNIGKKIKELRNQNKISQEKLAEILSMKRSAISQIENGDRKIYSEELKKIADIFNVSLDFLFNKEKSSIVILPKTKKNKISKKNEIRISVPQKNLEKFKQVLLYILNKVGAKPNIGETVIYKLLYFIDFDFYEKYEEQLIGATYIKNQYGPTPVEFKTIIEKMSRDGDIERVSSNYFKYPQTKYLPKKNADLYCLNANELELIDDVLNRLSDMTAVKISDYSHEDVPWLTTEKGNKIKYESVFYRTLPYSQRESIDEKF